MATETIKVPDIGGSEDVEVIEISVSVGDTVAAEDTLVVLETDKASMDIPCPKAGKVTAISVKEGDKVSEGSAILELELEGEGAGDDSQAESAESSASDNAAESKASEEAPKASGGSEMDIPVPDIGGSEGVEVIEVCVKAGDEVSEGDSLIVLETDKASMEIPAPVSSIALKEGDKVSEGDVIGKMKTAGGEAPAQSEPASQSASETAAPAAPQGGGEQDMPVPDIGGAEGVEVIEVSVKAGDEVSEGDTLIVLETDKASMEIPAPASGKIKSIALKEGDKVSQGDLIGVIEAEGSAAPAPSSPAKSEAPAKSEPAPKAEPSSPATATGASAEVINSGDVYAGPAVRRLGGQGERFRSSRSYHQRRCAQLCEKHCHGVSVRCCTGRWRRCHSAYAADRLQQVR